jgi:hypothetical protein
MVPPLCRYQLILRWALRSGRPDADEEDEVVGGVVGGRLKVTCRGRPRCFGGGTRPGGACATGRPLRGGLAGSVSDAFRRSVDTLSVLSPILRRKIAEEGRRRRLGGVDELSWQNQLRAEHRLRW